MSIDNAEKITELIMDVLREKNLVTSGASDTLDEDLNIPVGISNRHIHLSREDLEICFGKNYQLTPIKDLSQPGQFACKETMTICGPRGSIENVRVLGPVRKESQVEILASDNFKLGIKAPLRISGEIAGSSPITIVGSKGSKYLHQGAIVAARHIHMTEDDAKRFGVRNGQIVAIEVEGLRGGTYTNVVIRANDKSRLECHLDTEESNAMGLNSKSKIRIIK